MAKYLLYLVTQGQSQVGLKTSLMKFIKDDQPNIFQSIVGLDHAR